MNTLNTTVAKANDDAEALFRHARPSEARNLFYQVISEHEKATNPLLRVEVARAMYFAADCERALCRPDLAEKMQRKLQKRFGRSSNLQARHWAQLAPSISTSLPTTADRVAAFIPEA
jgi:hypothetical protein